jgi:hypothetical protein
MSPLLREFLNEQLPILLFVAALAVASRYLQYGAWTLSP